MSSWYHLQHTLSAFCASSFPVDTIHTAKQITVVTCCSLVCCGYRSRKLANVEKSSDSFFGVVNGSDIKYVIILCAHPQSLGTVTVNKRRLFFFFRICYSAALGMFLIRNTRKRSETEKRLSARMQRTSIGLANKET